MDIYSTLHFSNSLDSSFWAVCLVAFFGMFRKSHLLPLSASKFDPSKQLTKADFKVYSWGILITIRWSKTIQFREREVDIPIPCIPRSKLCPVTATNHALSFTSAPANSQAFNWWDPSSNAVKCLTYSMFISKLKHHLAEIGVNPSNFAGHSFRRGGASFAYQSGVPIELIKALGDWQSDAVLIYLTMPLTIRLNSANMLCKSVLSLTTQNTHPTH